MRIIRKGGANDEIGNIIINFQTVVFDPAAELTSRLNDEREFRFVEVPTAEGQQDADEGGDTAGDSGSSDSGSGGGDE